MSVTTEELRYRADGLNMIGHLARPVRCEATLPGVVVFPEALGIGDHSRGWAERIAGELGYVALAADLHGEGRVCGMDEMLPLLQPLLDDPGRIHARTGETLAALVEQPGVDRTRVAAVGFCIGGNFSFELALSGADLCAAMGLHSRLNLSTSRASPDPKLVVLAVVGADDPLIPAEQRAGFETQMRDLKIDWQLHVLGGARHSFTNPAADTRGMPDVQRYDARASERGWRLMADLLAERFGERRT